MEITEIKSRLTLAEVIKHYGFKADKQNRINCPFHPDKTPSLQLYYKTHTCYCFSSNCKTHGKSIDVIDFIMYKENINKAEAIQKAKQMITGTAAPAVQLTRTAILTKMFTYFKNGVHNSPPAKEYLEKRTLDYTKLEIGYNTGQFHHGTRRDEALIKSCMQIGLLSLHDRLGRTGEPSYKPFAKLCIVFALRNKTGQITGLYFRSTINDQEQRHFYLKDREGLYLKYPEPNTKKIILTESIIDAATLQQQEEITKHYHILALYGTNGMTEEHIEAITELKQLDEIIFFLNGDDAGRAAVKKHSEGLHKILPGIIISNIEPGENEDVNSLAQGHAPEIFTELINKRNFLFSIEKENSEPLEILPQSTEEAQQPEETTAPLKIRSGKLDTRNKEQIHYHTKELLITLLGGASLHNLDRLVVTLYMRRNPHLNSQQSIRQRVDLYQDDMTEKFIRRAAEKLEISTTYISKALSELTEELEAWRMQQAEQQQAQTPKRKELSPQEREQAIKDLRRKDLMQFTQEGLGMTGIVGEEKNRLIMYLIMTSRKRERPLHILSLGSSGSGKTHLQEQVGECIPEEDKLEITIMSDNAFYYFTREELKNVLILIEDLHGAQTVLYPLRELQTKQRITKTVTLKDKKGNLKTVQLVVEGPVSVAGCTTQEKIYEDNASRSFLIYIDESREQEEKVMEHQRKESAGLINYQQQQEMKERFKNMQRMLKPVRVKNPFAMELRIPDGIFKPKRTNAHYLQFIETISFYHQYQRETKTNPDTGEKYIETTIEDIDWANKLIAEVLLRKADELSGACRNFFEILKTHLQTEKKETFYAKEIRQALGLSIDKVKKYLIELNRNSYIKITGGNKYKTGFEYQVSDYEEYNKLKTGIEKVLNGLLENIRKKAGRETGKGATPSEVEGWCSSAEVVQKPVRTTQALEYQEI